jgi:hypothetical protein
MTLPTMAASAIKRADNDPTMRITYPATDFQIELSPGNVRILTIGTPDGFTVSFSLTEEFSQELGEAHKISVNAPRRTDRASLSTSLAIRPRVAQQDNSIIGRRRLGRAVRKLPCHGLPTRRVP